MAPFLVDTLSFLTQLYQYMAVVATPQTAGRSLATLRQTNADVWNDGDEQIGKNRRGPQAADNLARRARLARESLAAAMRVARQNVAKEVRANSAH